LLTEQLKLKNIELVNEVDDKAMVVKGNAIQLEQVLMNLISNARDAVMSTSDSGGRITVSTVRENNQMQLRVHDSGGGIPEHVIPHIFEPFFTTKPVGQGTGLGGSISYGIIREMQGDMWAENLNGGARITVSLPLVAES
jgi:C4-dicarboxylate-specific signal transduction histidine kinase